MIKLSVVIPCYNEEENISHIISKIKLLAQCQNEIEFLLVDNGSTDNSKEILAATIEKLETGNIRMVAVPVNKGYGYGIISGLKEASGEYFAWTHADLQTDPEDVVKAFELIKDKRGPPRTFVKGVRKNRNFIDKLFTAGMGIYSSLKLKCKLHDINAQPKLFHSTFFNSLENIPFDFSLDLFVYYHALKQNMEIVTFPVYFHKRKYGEAKGGGSLKTKWPLIIRTFKYINELTLKLGKS